MISKSSLNTWLSCRRKFYYSLLGFPEIKNDRMTYGLVFHDLLNKYNEQLMQGVEKKIKIEAVYETPFNNYTNEILPTVEKSGYQKVPFASEMRVVFENMNGLIDVVFSDTSGKKFLICDYKTVEKIGEFEKEKYKLELYIYAFLFSKIRNIPLTDITTALIRFQQGGKKFDINFIETIPTEVEEAVKSAEEMIKHLETSDGSIENFPKVSEDNNSYSCKYCDYRLDCI
jgi:CRISPR/Cas system-associated exonuclease Cas4 (RecB family)